MLNYRTVQLLLLLGWVDLNTGVAEACAYKLEGIEDLLELCGTPVVYGRSVDSPSLGKTMLRPPDYLSHPPACQCLPCTTIEYRRLVLESLTLRAAFCVAFGRPSDAVQSFQGQLVSCLSLILIFFLVQTFRHISPLFSSFAVSFFRIVVSR